MSGDNTIDWQQLVFDQASIKAFEKLAAKRFNEGVLAEEAVTHVFEGLSADDWARCKAFKGNSKPTTFLYSLASNLIEEFARKRFGRPRPPVWLQNQGELWIQMWKLLCLERQPLISIVDRLCATGAREPSFLENVARTIKARMPNCGLTAMDHESMEDVVVISDIQQSSSEDAGAGLEYESAAVSEVVLMLRSIIGEGAEEEDFSARAREGADEYATRQAGGLQQFRDSLSLTDEEKILLRMIYVDGFSKTGASKALGLQSHQAGRIVNSALTRIADAMSDCGISLEDLVEKI